MSIVQFFMLIPKIFFEIFFNFFWKILIFFEKSKKIQKTKFFKNSMHIWDQHEKLHWSCYLHQNRTNLTQLRKSTLKVKKMKKSRKKIEKKCPQKERHFWNQHQKLHYRRNFHQNRTSDVEGTRPNVKFL